MDEIRSYLLKEGTCKCGLECPVDAAATFDFDRGRQSEVLPFPTPSNTVASRHCAHKRLLVALAAADRTPGFINKIGHVHRPVLETRKG